MTNTWPEPIVCPTCRVRCYRTGICPLCRCQAVPLAQREEPTE